MSEYKMLPIKRPEGAISVGLPRGKPRLGKQPERVYYRVLKLSEDKKVATICSDMTKLTDGQLTVRDVGISVLGPNALFVGDILVYKPLDTEFSHPTIAHRYHQQHQHPKHLLAPDE